MRVFRKKYRRGGKLRQSRCWYVTWRDSFNDLRSTWRGYPTKTATEAYGRNLEALAASRATANLLDADMERWLNSLPTNTLQHLAERKLVEPVRLEAERPLDQHVEAYRQHRIDQRRNANDTRQTAERIKRMNAHAGFRSARDVTLPRIEKAIAKITEKHSTATRNRYGVVYHAFLEWMVDRGLIVANPMKGWKRAAEDATQHRRALDEDEATRLVAAAANGETASGLTRRGAALKRQGKDVPDSEIAWSLTGEDRAMLYRFALETALRSGTIARLTVRDFELAGDQPIVRVGGSVATKERAARKIPLRRETAAHRRHLARPPRRSPRKRRPRHRTPKHRDTREALPPARRARRQGSDQPWTKC